MSAVDDSKVVYYSGWDIDQLFATTSVSVVSTGTRDLYVIQPGLPTIPEFDVQFKPTGSSKYYQAGYYSTDGTLANGHSFYSWVDTATGKLRFSTTVTGTARFFVWTDKVNY